jgi:hypothetical protein
MEYDLTLIGINVVALFVATFPIFLTLWLLDRSISKELDEQEGNNNEQTQY